MAEKEVLARRIGIRLKKLRKRAGLTLKKLGEMANLSHPLLSRIENGLAMPSIITLETIAGVLRVDIGYFFKQEDEKGYLITNPDQRRITEVKRGSKKKVNYLVEHLADGMHDRWMEPVIVTSVGKDEEIIPITHDGQEFIYVIEGKIAVTLGEEKAVLKKGDALYLDGRIPHKAISLTKRPARAISVNLIPGSRSGFFENDA